jgi:hypothetical protein
MRTGFDSRLYRVVVGAMGEGDSLTLGAARPRDSSEKQSFYSVPLGSAHRSMAQKSQVAAEVVSQFFAAWNAPYEFEARKLLEATCNEQTHFVSAYGEHWGLSAQLESIGAFRRQFPKGRCSGRLLAEHHGWILVAWTTEFGDGRPPLVGVDAGLLGAGGRLTQMVSFSPVSSLEGA